jgi:hypothetical protein
MTTTFIAPDVAQTDFSLTSLGHHLETMPGAYGWLEDSRSLMGHPEKLREKLETDGYLYLRGALDADLVSHAGGRLLEQLSELEMLEPGTAVSDGIARSPWKARSCHSLVDSNQPLQQLLFEGRMISVFELLLNNAIRHFDFTWIRVMGPGKGTAPHADSVYMNRGTQQLYTAWTPLMEIPLDIGGLMIMPGSHRLSRLQKYFDSDVDTFCENRAPRKPKDAHEWIGPVGDGKLSENPRVLRERLGLPWLTAETYQPGDVLIFHIHTLHASLDNHSDRIRMSVDTRYQRADEPADPRWVGPNPPGHSKADRRSVIC